jgi:ATP-dependent Lhr-like helicase
MRFLFAWQRIDPEQRAGGLEGLASVIGQLDGFEVPAGAWESEVLSARCEEYDPMLLDTLSLTGRVVWGRTGGRADGPGTRAAGGDGQADGRSGGRGDRRLVGPIRSTPIALFLREHAADWLAGRNGGEYQLSSYAARVREVLRQRGASFFHELVPLSGLLPTQVEQALGELAGLGLVTSDSFAGLRALTTPSSKRKPLSAARRRHRTAPYGIESAGRWSLLCHPEGAIATEGAETISANASSGPLPLAERGVRVTRPLNTELVARTLLRRYGVVFKRLLARESGAPAWRELLMVYRRLEARGEIRGGRFVSGMSGEQFALPEAVGQLRSIRRLQGGSQLIGLSAADPLNLTGIITPGERIPGLTSNRILYRDGVPILAREAGAVRSLVSDLEPSADLVHALVRKTSTPALRSYLGMTGAPAASVPLNRRPGARHSRQKENVNSER